MISYNFSSEAKNLGRKLAERVVSCDFYSVARAVGKALAERMVSYSFIQCGQDFRENFDGVYGSL